MRKTLRILLVLFLLAALPVRMAVTVLVSPAVLLAKEKKPKKSDKASDYALIKGSVFKEDGFSVRGARVTCRKAGDTKPKWETTSGDGGEFAFRLPVGKMQYLITAEMKGFESVSKPVEIENDERQDISIILKSKTP